MSANHVLFFVHNGPREGQAGHMTENFNAMKAYWTKKKASGDIEGFESVVLASSGNPHMPAGFTLVTGDRAKLHQIRWDDAEFLTLHTTAMVTANGYACIDGYAGEE